jgi:signal transduction histidine kinase/DNA-binding response OmpR family regulator
LLNLVGAKARRNCISGDRMKVGGVAKKLLVILIIAELGCLMTAVGGLWMNRDAILRERKAELRAQVEAATSVIDQFHAEAAHGGLTEERAKSLALDAVRHIRYGVQGYLVVVSPDGVMLAHGAHPEFEGNGRGYLLAPVNDDRTIRSLIDRAHAGGDFVEFNYPRPEGGPPVAKLAYAQFYVPWDWVVFTGLYLDDVENAFYRQCLIMLAFLVPLTVLLCAQVMLLGRSILQPLQRLGRAMAERSEDISGQFRQPVAWSSDDELGSVVEAYNVLLARQTETERQLAERRAQLEELVKIRTAELEIARQQAEQSSRAKTDFLANISHEIRTPMNAVIGLSHLITRTKLDDHQRDYVSKIDSAAKSLLGIIDDILDFSRIEARHLSLEVVSFKLDDIMRTLSDLIALPAGAKGLEVVFDLDDRIPSRLRGDPLRLNQILTNLANNALKFTEKGVITVACKLVGGSDHGMFLRFSITDTGIGLTEAQQKQLFTPFTQAESSLTRRFGGAGLGLAICKQLVGMMGGEIGVDSIPGRGSTFWFTLRLGKDSDPGSQEPRDTATLFSGLKVLVADDNLLVRHTISAMLAGMGCRADAVSGGQQVLDALTRPGREPYDLLIIDWMMPEMDGVETIRRIHSAELPHQPRIIMVSGYGHDELLPHVLSLGLDGMLSKPVNRGQLIETLERCFRLSGKIAPHSGSQIMFAHGTRVLLVEDNEINRMVAEEILTKAGIEITVAVNGREGVDAVLSAPFDAVLMDIQMPVMDGYTATREIRSKPRFAALPIIAMTANATEADKFRAMDAGMSDHIAKPFDPENLLLMLQRWTNRPTVTAEPS